MSNPTQLAPDLHAPAQPALVQREEDLSAPHLWLLLWKAARAVEQHAHRSIARTGLTPSDFGVLEALLHKGPLTVNQLCEKVLLTSGSMSIAVDRLVARGLVERGSDPRDRRVRIVHLTGQGRELIVPAFADHRLALEAAMEGFGSEERAALLPLLRRLGRTAEGNASPG